MEDINRFWLTFSKKVDKKGVIFHIQNASSLAHFVIQGQVCKTCLLNHKGMKKESPI